MHSYQDHIMKSTGGVKKTLAQRMQEKFNDLMVNDTRPTDQRGVGSKPGKGKRVQILGATVTDVTPADPKDGGTLVSLPYPLFAPNFSIEDVNQGQLSDCYVLSMLGALTLTSAGKAILQQRLQVDPTDPTKVIATYFRNGTITRVHMSLLVSVDFNLINPDSKDLWVELFEKSYAYFRSGADTYASLNFGYASAVASDLGCTPDALQILTGQALIDRCKALVAAGNPVTFLTPPSPTNGTIIGSHSYTVRGVDANGNLLARNPWGNVANGGWVVEQVLPVSQVTSGNITGIEYGTTPVVVTPVLGEVLFPITMGTINVPSFPGVVLANRVSFKTGTVNLESTTSDGTQDLGTISQGDTMAFVVWNKVAGVKSLIFNCSCADQSSTGFDVFVGGHKVGSVVVPNTGAWTKYVPCTLSNVNLPLGMNEITLVATAPHFNLNNFSSVT